MPDLRSELMKLDNLKFDDDVADVPAPITNTKPNVTKMIWDAIKAQPNMNSKQIAAAVNSGDMSGISTRLKQMLNRGTVDRTIVDNTYVYQAVGESYPELNRVELMAKATAARKTRKHRKIKQREYNAKYKAKKQITLSTAGPLAVPATSLVSSPNAEQLVNSMSVGMAKAVYLELKKVFEG